MTDASLFPHDLEADLQGSEFRRAPVLQSLRAHTVGEIISQLDAAREARNLSKADVARAINADPAVIRRLFSAHGNPTLGRLAEIAAALGMRVSLEPLPTSEAEAIASSLGVAATASRNGGKRSVRQAVPSKSTE